MEGCVLPKKDGFCNTGILAADPLAPSSEPPTSEFPHTALVCSALPIPEPRETGYKLSFVHWPFKRVCVPLALSCGRQKPCCFSQPDAVGAFPSAGALGWGAQTGLLHILHTPYQSHCGEVVPSVCPFYKASLQLLFTWLFWIISLQFSCSSRLVLGGG